MSKIKLKPCPLCGGTYDEKDSAEPLDKAISVIQEIIECIDEDFPLLDFNSRYMMERGMRMALIQIKKIRKDGISND